LLVDYLTSHSLLPDAFFQSQNVPKSPETLLDFEQGQGLS